MKYRKEQESENARLQQLEKKFWSDPVNRRALGIPTLQDLERWKQSRRFIKSVRPPLSEYMVETASVGKLRKKKISRPGRLCKNVVRTANRFVDDLAQRIADWFGVEQGQIFSMARPQPIALARQVLVYVLHERGMNDKTIGHHIGRDRATVYVSWQRIKELLSMPVAEADQIRTFLNTLNHQTKSS